MEDTEEDQVTSALQPYQGKQLSDAIAKIENLEADKKEAADDIKTMYAALKEKGFCAKTVRKLVALRKKDQAERQSEEAMLAMYAHAIGMASTPLGAWADEVATKQLASV